MRRFTLLNFCYLLMTKTIVYAAALIAAIAAALSTRFIIPALILVYRSIEQSFAPIDEPHLQLAGDFDFDGPHWYEQLKAGVTAQQMIETIETHAVTPVEDAPKPAPKKRVTRRRSAKAGTTKATTISA